MVGSCSCHSPALPPSSDEIALLYSAACQNADLRVSLLSIFEWRQCQWTWVHFSYHILHFKNSRPPCSGSCPHFAPLWVTFRPICSWHFLFNFYAPKWCCRRPSLLRNSALDDIIFVISVYMLMFSRQYVRPIFNALCVFQDHEHSWWFIYGNRKLSLSSYHNVRKKRHFHVKLQRDWNFCYRWVLTVIAWTGKIDSIRARRE